MKQQKFEKLVVKAILDLPRHIREKMDNLVICIEDRASLSTTKKVGTKVSGVLLGLYEGVPKTVVGRSSFSGRLPDKITIFQKAIEDLVNSEEDAKELVRIVVWHEVAHHFGLSERRFRLLENKWRQRKNENYN